MSKKFNTRDSIVVLVVLAGFIVGYIAASCGLNRYFVKGPQLEKTAPVEQIDSPY